jgi:hypothetical protein
VTIATGISRARLATAEGGAPYSSTRSQR